MPNESQSPIPHLRMMVVLSTILLALVIGDAELVQTVGTPLVGLRFGNPWVVELFLLVFLTYQMWQFWVGSRDKWQFNDGVIAEAMQLIKIKESIKKRLLQLLGRDTEELVAGTGLAVKEAPLSMRWQVAIVSFSRLGSGETTDLKTVNLKVHQLFWWKVQSFLKWAWNSKNFPTRQLPFALAVFAWWLGLMRVLLDFFCAK